MGVLPPIDQLNPASAIRSPYATDVRQLVERFCTSLERCDILSGFLRHRSEIHRIGIVSGLQWLDGSFMEDVELLEGRAPNDIDVVTFAGIPAAILQALTPQNITMLTDNRWIKETSR
ncbi:hypothetical protein L682_01095 [Aquipseudomonas alcaligenes OT 69]|nr:hypothetical protein L682_01095 [Pseudomonas alcaligenes OT 69]